MTAAAAIQPTLTLTWQRLPARAVGTLLGVGVFMLLAPVAHHDPVLAALLISEFGQVYPPAELVTDRLLDTVLGIAVGFLVCLAIHNPHLHRGVGAAVLAVDAASLAAERLAAEGSTSRERRAAVRRDLYAAHSGLRVAAGRAAGEWRAHHHDTEAVARAEERAYRALASVADDGADER